MHLWPAPLCIFPHYLVNGTILGMLLNIKYMFQFSLQLLSEKFFILRGTERNIIKNVRLVFMYICPYSFPILLKLEFS